MTKIYNDNICIKYDKLEENKLFKSILKESLFLIGNVEKGRNRLEENK